MSAGPQEYWKSAGVHLLERDGQGRLKVTDDFIRAYLLRPEMIPVAESCTAETELHENLMTQPRRAVDAEEIAKLVDPDARENYGIVLAFRDHLLVNDTLEAAYLTMLTRKDVHFPPLFADQLVQAILRNILDDCTDPVRVRAAELLFRSQKVSLSEGAIMLADEETVDMYAETGGFGELGRFVAESQTPLRQVELDVLDERNGETYWARSDRYDTVLDVSFGRFGLDALCRVLEAWVEHFLTVEVSVQPVPAINDERWVWHIGLDPESNGLLNDLYNGRDVSEARQARLLSLFRLDFKDSTVMLSAIAGRPVYLGMAMSADNTLKLKPQNLLLNLPLAESS